MKTTTLKPITLKTTGTVIPVGTPVDVTFISVTVDESREIDAMEITLPSGEKFKSTHFTKYFKVPSLKTLEKWTFDSVCKSVSGKRCEPDGHGDDKSPSWLLALHMI